VWLLDEQVHHSIESADDGTLWAPGIAVDGLADSQWLQERVRDDAILQLSQQGRVMQRISVIGLLRRNGLQALALGLSGEALRLDPIHLNQITPAASDTAHWRRGDLLLSLRNISTVLLYRPATGQVLWHRTGPWLNQHAAMFVDDSRVSVFDNNVHYPAPPASRAFVTPQDHSRVFLVDLATGAMERPYDRTLSQVQLQTVSQGRARVLPGGDLFVEDTTGGRLLRVTADKVVWSWVNDYDATHIGLLGWSRYLTEGEAAGPLQALARRACRTPS
jgi:hypothetical protein